MFETKTLAFINLTPRCSFRYQAQFFKFVDFEYSYQALDRLEIG